MTSPGQVAGPGQTRAYTIAHLPGDGIGPEVTAVARDCVDAAAARHGFAVEWRGYPLGAQHFLATGEVLPDAVLDELRKADAILLGAVGSPDVPPGVLERGLLLRLRAELDLYVNLRPSKLRPGVAGAVGRHPAGRPRLRDRAREHRGPVRGRGRHRAPRHRVRERDRGVAEHPGRGGALRAVRRRAGLAAARRG